LPHHARCAGAYRCIVQGSQIASIGRRSSLIPLVSRAAMEFMLCSAAYIRIYARCPWRT